jgi:DNA-binding transcriptional LysR family regulator
MLERLDLNLLRAFEALYGERSVTLAAGRLGVTQPAMSNALARLRVFFDDPLFVRSPGGMSPTPRSDALAPHVERALEGLREAIGGERFEPAAAAARVTVGTVDYMESLYLSGLLGALGRLAPRITLQIKRLDSIFELPEEQFRVGAVDCALGLFPQPVPPQAGLYGEVLRTDGWACVGRQGHPALRGTLTLETYAKLRHISVWYQQSLSHGVIDRQLSERGLWRDCALVTSHFMTAAAHLAASDCVTTVPTDLAEALAAAAPLQIAQLPWEMAPAKTSLVWSTRLDRSPLHRWFRDLVRGAVTTRSAVAPVGESE